MENCERELQWYIARITLQFSPITSSTTNCKFCGRAKIIESYQENENKEGLVERERERDVEKLTEPQKGGWIMA